MEVGAHLRALVFEYRMKSEWSYYLPLVQRILNYTEEGSIGTQHGRVLFGDGGLRFGKGSRGTSDQNPEDYRLKLREAQSTLV